MRVNYMSILDCIVMLLIDCVVYFLLAIYLDNVVPGEFGQTKSLFFCFTPSYWLNKSEKIKQILPPLIIQDVDFEPVENEFKNQEALRY
jgi:ATP-binding cassette subfamily A (ABC1) protein 5